LPNEIALNKVSAAVTDEVAKGLGDSDRLL
jgi:hypothetical protein